MKEFLDELTDFLSKSAKNQIVLGHAKELFTTICYINDIRSDSEECDRALDRMYASAAMDEACSREEFFSLMKADLLPKDAKRIWKAFTDTFEALGLGFTALEPDDNDSSWRVSFTKEA